MNELQNEIINRIKEQNFSINYIEAITLGESLPVGEIKYLWNKNNLGIPYLKGIIWKKFDGLILEVLNK